SGDFGIASLLLLFGASGSSSDGGSASIEPAPTPTFTSVPPPTLPSPITVPEAAARATLDGYATAEDAYRATHSSYTSDVGVLQSEDSFDLPATTVGTVTIPRADADSFCLEYFSGPDRQTFTYDSNVPIVTPGATC